MRHLAIVGEDGQIRVEDLDAAGEVLASASVAGGIPEGASTICNGRGRRFIWPEGNDQ